MGHTNYLRWAETLRRDHLLHDRDYSDRRDLLSTPHQILWNVRDDLYTWKCANCGMSHISITEPDDSVPDSLCCDTCQMEWAGFGHTHIATPHIRFEPTEAYQYLWNCPGCESWEGPCDEAVQEYLRCQTCQSRWKRVRTDLPEKEGVYLLARTRLELVSDGRDFESALGSTGR